MRAGVGNLTEEKEEVDPKFFEGAHAFAWPLPTALRDGAPRVLQVWNIATGQELAGSPIALGSGGVAVAAPSNAPPLSRWEAPLAGHVSAEEAVELAAGLWVAAESPAERGAP